MAQGDRSEGSTTSEGLPGGWGPEGLAAENLRLQAALHQAQEATEQFIDFVAHELKQPMTSLKGYTQMLIMGIAGDLTPLQRQFVDIIHANAGRMDKLVNDLLNVSRLEAGRIQLDLAPVKLKELLDGVLAGNYAEIEARHHTLEVDVAHDLPPVLADRERLAQIVGHLVRNASRYTPEGGRIRLAAAWQETAARPAGHVCILVVDSGIGLSAAEILRLGEKFFRAEHELVLRQPGNGLGLCITRHLVALHGSALVVESEPGRGSTFSFTLPVDDS